MTTMAITRVPLRGGLLELGGFCSQASRHGEGVVVQERRTSQHQRRRQHQASHQAIADSGEAGQVTQVDQQGGSQEGHGGAAHLVEPLVDAPDAPGEADAEHAEHEDREPTGDAAVLHSEDLEERGEEERDDEGGIQGHSAGYGQTIGRMSRQPASRLGHSQQDEQSTDYDRDVVERPGPARMKHTGSHPRDRTHALQCESVRTARKAPYLVGHTGDLPCWSRVASDQ